MPPPIATDSGSTLDGAGGLDAWILKLDANGNIEWQKTYGWDENENASCVKQTSDGSLFPAHLQYASAS